MLLSLFQALFMCFWKLLVLVITLIKIGKAIDRPIIGLLAQETSEPMRKHFPEHTSYISAGYVKALESSGARVVPIFLNKTEEYYKSLNGLLLPGGNTWFFRKHGYADAGSVLYDEAKKTLWVWCYCLGIPLLASDLCVLSQYIPDPAPIHLGIPLYTLVTYHHFPNYLDPFLLSVSHTMSILFLSVCSACEGHLCGYALAFLHFFTMWRMGSDERAHVDWAANMTMSNFLALNVIEWIIEEKRE